MHSASGGVKVRRDFTATTGKLFDRGGGVVVLQRDRCSDEVVARPLTTESVIIKAHEVAQPMVWKNTKGKMRH